MSAPDAEIPPLYTGPSIYPNAIILPILALFSLLITIPPLVLNIKTCNLTLIILTISVMLLNLQNIINPIIWPNDDKDAWFSGVILCDIETKLQLGLATGIPAATTCICRNLATILSPNPHSITPTSSNRKCQLNLELALCIGLPILTMSTHILVQPARYYISGISGCQYCLAQSLPTLLLIQIWPILLFVISSVYAGLIVIRLIGHRRQTSTLLANAQTSRSRFVRVFVLALAIVVLCGPVTISGYIVSWQGSTWVWRWKEVHTANWNMQIINLECHGKVWYERWVQVANGFVLFALFGIGRDATVMYSRWAERLGLFRFWRVVRRWVYSKSMDRNNEVNGSHIANVDAQLTRSTGLDRAESATILGNLDSLVNSTDTVKKHIVQTVSKPRELEG